MSAVDRMVHWNIHQREEWAEECAAVAKLEGAAAIEAAGELLSEALVYCGIACQKCLGKGRRMYPNTATWDDRPGQVVGRAMTEGVCDECWGSGTTAQKGPDLREMQAQLKMLEELKRRIRLGQPIGKIDIGE